MFGITHPQTSLRDVHQGEYQLFHALAPQGLLKEAIKNGAWSDMPKVLPAQDRGGEIPEIYAPHILERNKLYYMVYAPNPIRLATSPDLKTWTPQGVAFMDRDPSARDPNILFWKGTYHMVYVGVRGVSLRTTKDLRHWGQPKVILDDKAAESPSLIRQNRTFYLFVCPYKGIDQKTLLGAYEHKTYVYQSDSLSHFEFGGEVTILDAHAPEVFQGEDGSWYISSVEWPERGVSLARLVWE
jgi:beta-fructofuranosidase